ncbi:tRNA (N6-threonylcarbamoyladenosine(37)-N6)-methyltransferase TrmO [Pyrococcus sp. ST04]|uniref:tRNA (N6-threonylcarbamoyladenosine(37)-N6)-methyltransferase TrmO n=1 Tax=Pyrococcus sp. ST04 TaxID=1183377 RepID=UPI0002605887|nr:tRNA (N6-threonylcarbamoyladenosine(37)-N6)-methyltransferase TrmO [Pyrococcus sp. ST04]AFK22188.1 hypothetical protein Py04_0586 [Pyrococcus sp. ST04]
MFSLIPIGYIRKEGPETWIEILPEFEEGLEGLEEGDWIKVIAWLHESDTSEKRKILKVHHHGDLRNPVVGVFATRSPVRPNPLALYAVRINRIEGRKLYIPPVDAYDGTPVVDIKILVDRLDCPREEIELDENSARKVGDLTLVPRRSEHMDELEEVSPEEFDALIISVRGRSTVLTATDLVELIKALVDLYELLPVEVRDKLGIKFIYSEGV